jgi:hypothetical protein
MFPHPVHDSYRSAHTRCAGGFGRYRERIYQCLRVMLSDFCEQIIYVPPDVSAGSLDAGNDLGKNNERCTFAMSTRPYLGNDV